MVKVFALLSAIVLTGCVENHMTFPSVQAGIDTGHCWALTPEPRVLACTYLRNDIVTHELCILDSTWWCSGRLVTSTGPCFLCGVEK